MNAPDFLVIGAQKSGTTTLFSLLSKHPNIYLPPQKEVQFFSNDMLYSRGVEWYCSENFSAGKASDVLGEISPQYMAYEKVPGRIKELLPSIKLIAILRHPLERAFSQYQMTVRRGQENRGFLEAFEHSLKASKLGEVLPEGHAYYQYSNYMDIIKRYLALFPKKQILLLFQEDLGESPELVLSAIYEYLGVPQTLPENSKVRLHAAGTIKYSWLDRFLRGQGAVRSLLKRILPWRLRAAIKYWVEQFNINKSDPQHIPDEVLRDYNWVVIEQKAFLKDTFGIDAPWQEWSAPQ